MRVIELYQQQIDALSMIKEKDYQYVVYIMKRFQDTQFHYNQRILKDLDEVACILFDLSDQIKEEQPELS
ncbi:hypothetical protein ACQV2S_02800 [Facklamia sp. P13064]|uniref:hypothetical protein n=1 Tax=Facklamia sp. P13064 TaxID=3421953 RepID=UPI003D180417